MADNTLQFDWISILKWNLDYQFANDPSVFVAGDHLIYAEEGNNKYRVAPDVYVAFGRPKGRRGSYKVWEEDGIFPQVVFEVWSPSNRLDAMQKKFEFYQLHGVQEYYIIYPETPASVKIWRRAGENLIVVPDVASWVSPRTGIRLEVREGEVAVFGPNGKVFDDPIQMASARDRAMNLAQNYEKALDSVNQSRDAEYERAEKLAAKLRELGIDPDSI